MDLSDAMSRGAVPDHGPAVFAVTTATLVLASVFVAARMISRFFIVKNVTWDDRVMILAWLFAFFLSFTICLGVSNGLGRHDEDIRSDQIPTLRHCEYVFSILYNPALMATKTSILIFYLRLARDTQTVLRIASWATLAVLNIAGVILTFMNVFQCRPTEAAYNSNFTGMTTCIPLLTEFICAAPVNVITDLAILALPIPVLTGMRLPSRQKTILVLTFTLGVFVTIVDVVRIYYLQQAIVEGPSSGSSTSDPRSRFGGQEDFAYNASLSLMWSAVEVNVAMTCACIPTLKPLVLMLLPSILYDPEGTRRTRHSRRSAQSSSSTSKGPQDSETHSSIIGASVLAQPEPALDSSPHQRNASDATSPTQTNNVEFMMTPEMNSNEPSFGALAFRARTNQTMTTNCSYENGVYFGFVNMTKPKSMLRANKRESLKYCTIVSILFVLWGVSYGLLNTLNTAVAAINHMSTAQALGLTSAYFGGGYFFGPLLVGEWLLRRDEHSRSRRHRRTDSDYVGGYKVTFIVGLCIYGTGTIIFWPSAVTASYGGFMLSNFVVGFGLSVLEVAANSFMVLCGPPEYGEARLLIAQAFQAVGSVLSGLLAQKVFFRSLTLGTIRTQTLLNVQWTYLGITLLCVGLALFFYYMPLPEVGDSELEESTKRLPLDPRKKSVGGVQLRTISLVLAVIAQYVYVGGQEANSTFFRSLLVAAIPGQPKSGMTAASGTLVGPNISNSVDRPAGFAIAISDYLSVGHTAFAIGRFIAGYLAYLSVKNPRAPKPRTVLAGCIALCFTFALIMVLIKPSDPNLLFIPSVLFFLCEGPIWPLVFAMGLRGQGSRTKRAAAFITMGASGPACIPFIMYGIITKGGQVQLAFLVLVVIAVIMMFYPAFLTLVRDARLLVDPCPDTRDVATQEGERPRDEMFVNDNHDNNNNNNTTAGVEGVSEKSNGILEKVSKGLGAKFIGSRRKSSPTPEVEHTEVSRDGDH
ncbi:6-deoxy-L-galactose permease-like protein [Cladobotryum mycophilum]|uniref:6-deoxy-L-galactose permease-like protein n=1 Tax=Cladobotryum mycophilum TaxID=491253 RepID=A0ABR0S5H2_9HYPO